MRRWVALLMLLALLAGCAQGTPSVPTDPQAGATPEPGQPSGDEAVTISFAAFDYERGVYERLAQSFNTENPGIKVVIVPMEDLTSQASGPTDGSDQPDSQLAMLRRIVSGADTAPAAFVPPEAFGTTLLYDMTPLMEADPNFKRDDFYPGALERYTVKGGTWVLPRYFYIQLLSYNKDLFKQAGVADPKPEWTWTDLMAIAQQLVRKNGSNIETYGFFDYSNGFLPLLADLEAQKIDLFSTPVDKLRLDSPEMVAAVKRMRSLQESGALFEVRESRSPNTAPADPSQLVRDGRVGIWMQDVLPTSTDPSGNPQKPPFSIGTLPYPPVAAMNLMGFGANDGYVISGGTAHPNESWKWIEYISRQQTDQQQGEASGAPGRVPARKSLAEATGFWKSIESDKAAAYQWAVEHTPAAPANVNQTDSGMILGALQQAYSSLSQDPKADVSKALAEAQKQLQEQIAQVRLTPTPKPDLSQVVVATPETQEAPEGATKIKFAALNYNPSDLRRISRTFRDQHPDIFVEIKSTDFMTGPMEIKDIARSSDCFSWWGPPQSADDFAALLDLKPLIDADTSFTRDDIPAALYGPYDRNGGTFGLPYAFSLRSLGFNRTALDAAGVKVPTAAWKPEDFLNAAQALTKGEGEKKLYGYVPLGGSPTDLFFFIGQFGGRISTGSGDDLRPNFTDPAVVKAIQWYMDLSKVHKVAPPLKLSYRRDDNGSDNSYDLVRSGRAGMWFDYGVGSFGGGEPVIGIPEKPIAPPVAGPDDPKFETGVAPLPVGGGGLRSSDINVRGFHISASSQHQQECWSWIKFLSSDLTNMQSDVPARKSIALSEDYAKVAQTGMVDLYKAYSSALNRSGEQGDNMNDVFQRFDTYWLFKAISEANEKNKDLSAELTEAQKQTTAYVECMVKEKQKKPATCAQRVDPTYQGYNTEDPPADGGKPRG
jgi:multiple sugar transport system substrate-binding protein